MLTIEFIVIVLLLYGLLCLSGYGMLSILRLETRNIFTVSFLGIFILGLWTSLLQIFIPLSGLYTLLCLLPTLLGIKKAFNLYLEWKVSNKHFKFLPLVLFSIPFVFICLLAMSNGLGNAYDADLYHYQIILWYKEFALVPGLGNLHSRLANSSTWYVLISLLPDKYIPYIPMISTATFYPLLFGWLFTAIKNCEEKFQQVYLLVFSVFTIWYYIFRINAELFTDPIALSISGIAFYYFLSLIFGEKSNARQNLILGFLLITLSFSIKSLAAVSVVFACLLGLIALYKKIISYKDLCIALIFPIFMAIIWITRNIITSGYPVFPISILSFGFDWKMLAGTVNSNSLDVQGWARWPQAGYQEALQQGINYWFPSWIERYIDSSSFINFVLIPLILSGIAVLGLIKKRIDKLKVFFLVWAIANICVWFYLYPDPRFGRDYFWILLALTLSLYTLVFTDNRMFKQIWKQKNVLLTLLFAFFVGSIIKESDSIKLSWSLTPWPKHPTITIDQLPANNGKYSYSSPLQGDDRCGYTPVPCSPHISQQLHLRNVNDLGEGFYISDMLQK